MSSVLGSRSQEHGMALAEGRDFFCIGPLKHYDLCMCTFLEPVKLAENVHLPRTSSIYKLASFVQLNEETKGGISGKISLNEYHRDRYLRFFMASLTGLKISEGDFSQHFFCFLFCTSEEMNETGLPSLYYSRTGVSWWSGGSVSNMPAERNSPPPRPPFTLFITCETHPAEITRSKV